MMNKKIFFSVSMPIILAACSIFCDSVNAAPRTAVRNQVSRKSTTVAVQNIVSVDTEETTTEEPQPTNDIIVNKSNQFDVAVADVLDNADSDNSFAEQIRKQRAALAASDAATLQKRALQTNSNTCDIALRKCMMQTCGNDFTKCALDGDSQFGDKLNKCKRDTSCNAHEFALLAQEIKDDRDMNVRLASYESTINCGNQYNACIVNECGTTYSKCLGKKYADVAIEKCKTIADECIESDSGLASRFGTVIGLMRENAEKDIVNDENKLNEIRESMEKTCKSFGAMFDERSFDCVYTVNFFAGENQNSPLASRKGYAGDTFVCMQEWFGINATTFKENAYRETRSQTAASSAMLGSGLGTATGLITSGAIGRAVDTQKAKKELKEECESQQGMTMKNGKCVAIEANTETTTTTTNETPKKEKTNKNKEKKTGSCKDIYGGGEGTYDENGKCILKKCNDKNYYLNTERNKCELNTTKKIRDDIAAKKEACTSPKIWKAGSCWCPNGFLAPDNGECKQ